VPDDVVDAATLESYVGRYRFFRRVHHDRYARRARLVAFFEPPGLRARLHPRAPDDFAVLAPRVDVRFAGSGAATKVVLTQTGHPSDIGTRLP